MSTTKFLVQDVNEMNLQEFTFHFGSVIYGTTAAISAWTLKPFTSFQDLYQAFVTFTKLIKHQVKEDLIRRYPDLTGKLLELKNFSQGEQKGAGLHNLTDEEATELEDLNNLYKKKFNFPFITCVRENTKDSIFQCFRTRLKNGVFLKK